MQRDTVLILDFGSQYTQLIARRLRELQVYSEILPPSTGARPSPRATRGASCSRAAPTASSRRAPRAAIPGSSSWACPCSGVCYGMQLMSHLLGGELKPSARREYGPAELRPGEGLLLRRPRPEARVWMSHGDSIQKPPPGFTVVASSGSQPGGRHRSRASAVSSACSSIPRSCTPQHGTTRALELPRRVRLPARLERGVLRGGVGGEDPGAGGGEGPGDLRPVRRGRLGGGGPARPARDRRAADLRLRGQRPAAQGRGGAGAQALRGAPAAEGAVRGRLATFPRASSGA